MSRGRLHRSDLEIPFRGVRSKPVHHDERDELDPFARQTAERRLRAHQYAPRLRPGQFLSHETAIALRGGPLPLVWEDDKLADGRALPVHVSTLGDGPLVRAVGVRGHRADPRLARAVRIRGIVVASPATAWAQLAAWSVFDLVALGDYLCRMWRPGPGRRTVGRRPFTTIPILHETIAAGRWAGIRNLREAVTLIREDSWSPRESKLRLRMQFAGLPEPALNHDVYDHHGRFLGCVDLAYPEHRIAIEYQGELHSSRYAADVERIAALRAAGWTVIEVTSDLFARPDDLIARIRSALQD